MEITSAMIKELREKTGVGIMDCKGAHQESEGDIQKAIEILRKKGIATSQKRSGRTTSQGQVHSYIHAGGKIGVLVEVNCETDFVARSESFRTFAHDISLQVAASSPQWVVEEDIPQDVLDHEAEIARNRALEEGKYPLGIFYEDNSKPTFSEANVAYAEDKSPLYRRELDKSKLQKLIESKRVR